MGIERTFSELKALAVQTAIGKLHEASAQLAQIQGRAFDSQEEAITIIDAGKANLAHTIQIGELIAYLDETYASIKQRFEEAGIALPPEEVTLETAAETPSKEPQHRLTIPPPDLPEVFFEDLQRCHMTLTPEVETTLAYSYLVASNHKHNYIGTEHILLALIHEDGRGTTVIKQLGVQPEKVTQAIEFVIGRADKAGTGDITLAHRAKIVLDLSLDESRRRNKKVVETDDILVGLVREGGGVAAEVLGSLGVNVDKARRAVQELHLASQA